MICLICRQAQLVDGFTVIDLGRAEFKLVVRNVPAHICPACGEAYVDEVVAERILQQAEEKSRSGDWSVFYEYE